MVLKKDAEEFTLTLFQEIRRANKSLREAISESEQKRFEEELTRTALQVAHDIGSPLAVLEAMIQSTSLSLPEESRISMRNVASRIRDISNSLLKKVKRDLLSANEGSLTQQLLFSLINTIATEKRLQFSSMGLKINFNSIESSYGLFAMVKIADFSRILSNIINNSIDAVESCGNILISLSKNENYSVITIEDNGSGIPLDVLSKLGELGVTYGKRNGLGLGLFHAKQTVEKWNGKIDIQSLIHKGTTVKIYLPVAQPPEWFISSIKIINDQDIIIIDDDASIHDVWIMRFNDFQGKFNMSVKLHHFYSPDEFSLWKSSRESNNSIIYLCDYEFIGSKENGVDLITKFQINYLSILVTSRVNSEELTSKCESSGIKLLPKDMASFIPIIPFPQ